MLKWTAVCTGSREKNFSWDQGCSHFSSTRLMAAIIEREGEVQRWIASQKCEFLAIKLHAKLEKLLILLNTGIDWDNVCFSCISLIVFFCAASSTRPKYSPTLCFVYPCWSAWKKILNYRPRRDPMNTQRHPVTC